MSFLKPAADGMTGLGSSLGFNPTGIQNFGTAMNGIASVGGATPGYAGQMARVQKPTDVPAPPTNNIMQQLHPDWLRAILEQFRGVKHS